MLLLSFNFLDASGHPTSAPQYSNSSKYITYAHNKQKYGHSLRGFFHGRRQILMDFHPYGYETYIFTLSATHEEVQGRQTKLHQGFTPGKLVQPSPGSSILRDSHIVLFNSLDAAIDINVRQAAWGRLKRPRSDKLSTAATRVKFSYILFAVLLQGPVTSHQGRQKSEFYLPCCLV